jgi:hypothetical protein
MLHHLDVYPTNLILEVPVYLQKNPHAGNANMLADDVHCHCLVIVKNLFCTITQTPLWDDRREYFSSCSHHAFHTLV